jgi:hypothetical protein
MLEVCGANNTFPEGKRTPPLKYGEVPDTLVNWMVFGLYIPIADAFPGTNRTLPSGRYTDPE